MKICPLCNKEFERGDVCDVDGATLVHNRPDGELAVGQTLKGSYRIEERIAAGGMGIVYRATQLRLERPVAVKTLLPQLVSTPTMVQRFFQEARLISQLNHPHVVSIFDFGNTEDGVFFMVMELLEGRPLGDLVPRGGGLSRSRAVELMLQICSGVGSAHRSGLIHRDLKPDNIFVVDTPRGEDDRAKVLDFGIARSVEEVATTRLTQSGMIMGTPSFIAPEQIEESDAADARSDIYALGAILCFLLTGRKPYEGETPPSILAKQLLHQPRIDELCSAEHPDLSAVVLKAMQRAPEDRYQTTEEMIRALSEVPAERAERPQGSVSSARSSAPVDEPPQMAPEPADSGGAPPRNMVPRALAAVATLLLVFGALWWARGPGFEGTKGIKGTEEAAYGVAEGPQAEEIRIGMSAAFSGPSRELGRAMQIGIETRFREINAAGGVAGRNLRLIALDDAYTPSRTVANVSELLQERDVFAFLGNVGTPTAEVALPLLRQAGVPLIAPFTGAGLLRVDPPEPHLFHYRASYTEETAALVRYFVDQQGIEGDQLAVLAQDDVFGDEGYAGVVAALRARGFDGDVPRLGYRRNSVDVHSAVQTLLRDLPEIEAVVLVATYRSAASFIRQTSEAGRDLSFACVSFVGSLALAEELRELGDGLSAGVIVSQVVPHYAGSLPGVQRYREQLRLHFPAESPDFVSLEGYLAAGVLEQALRAAFDRGDPLDRAHFLEAFEALGAVDLGIGESLVYSETRHQGSQVVWGTMLDERSEYQPLDL